MPDLRSGNKRSVRFFAAKSPHGSMFVQGETREGPQKQASHVDCFMRSRCSLRDDWWTTMTVETVPFGNWRSPVTVEHVAGKALRFGQTQSFGDLFYWTESRPWEEGRAVIVCRTADGVVEDVLPLPYSARSKVHEYGGGEFSVGPSGTLYFVNAADQDIYAIDRERNIRRITSAPDWRFSDIAEDLLRNRLIAVGERRRTGLHDHPDNMLVTIGLDAAATDGVDVLVAGADFYASPQLNDQGDRIAWLQWSLPNMPWEAAALAAGVLDDDGLLGETVHVAGGNGTCVFQPEWTGAGGLIFIWNRSGWGNPFLWDGTGLSPLIELNAEFGRPQWVFGMRSYAQCQDGSVIFSYLENGAFRTGILSQGTLNPLDLGVLGLENPSVAGARLFGTGLSDTRPSALLEFKLAGTPAAIESSLSFRSVADVDIPVSSVSIGQPVAYPCEEGRSAHAIFYPPTSGTNDGPVSEKPPAIILIHGGPTGYADRGLKLKTQYWTSRGFAVLDVDFTGSFGYGSAYRKALNGLWGIADAQDAAAGARWLAETGNADPARIAIAGGSSGGYTVLSALTRHDEFAAGAAYYGISDVYRLARSTHKFEAGYVETLTGIAPDAPAEAYRTVSPIYHADKIGVPVILFQGLEDFVVPPDQSRNIADALVARGVSVVYREYEGEGHGFRKAATQIDAIAHEHAFYAAVFGLQPVDDLPEVRLGSLEKHK